MSSEENLTKTPKEEIEGVEGTRSGRFFRPNVDILEKTDELLIQADIPGASAESVDVDFEDGLLTISAQVPERDVNREYLMREYEIGDYRRTFRVSEAIDASQITAEYKEGVLTLRLPKSSNVKARKISVSTAG